MTRKKLVFLVAILLSLCMVCNCTNFVVSKWTGIEPVESAGVQGIIETLLNIVIAVVSTGISTFFGLWQLAVLTPYLCCCSGGILVIGLLTWGPILVPLWRKVMR